MYVGAPLRRLEDPRLLRGQANYIEDLDLPRVLCVAFARSDFPHARLASVDLGQARSVPGVVAVFDGGELGTPRIEATVTHPALRPCAQPSLADQVVRYVGEPIAVVAAETRATAQDGVSAIAIDYEPLDALGSAEAAVAEGAVLLHPHLGDNLAGSFSVQAGDPATAFANAERIISGRFYVQRYTGMPLEARGVAAAWDSGRQALTLWSSTQWPHTLRESLSSILGLPEHKTHVIAPDVGGGFGIKQDVYPEEVVLAQLAQRLGRPVKWVETRREHLCTGVHAREQCHDMQL